MRSLLFGPQVITAYTVRAKQGKSQLNHLKGGGGHGRMSVGGGLRARETKRLFEDINEVLLLYFTTSDSIHLLILFFLDDSVFCP